MLRQKKQVPFMQPTKHIRAESAGCEAKSFAAGVCPLGIGRVHGKENAEAMTSLAARRCLDKRC